MISFPAAQPSRDVQEPPNVGWAIAYFLFLPDLAMALPAGLKPRAYEKSGHGPGSSFGEPS